MIYKAAHDGYERLSQPVTHERALVIAGSSWLAVVDYLSGNGRIMYESFLHLHPDLKAGLEGRQLIAESKEVRFRVLCYGDEELGILATEYYPAFGMKLPRSSFVMNTVADLPAMTAYALSFDGSYPEIRLDSRTGKVHFSAAPFDAFDITFGL